MNKTGHEFKLLKLANGSLEVQYNILFVSNVEEK